ncbi:Hsp33 protein [Novosphingobium nitrogenifigens DSM 19370]|uniref:Hsp33 protein n=1 Tax=Novosphingobium nitrogenifigens DSM 19370 TaxID=983920 RepID=F1ZDR5_9SPHN|nr:Hsp33 family molecular chaperone HslO [Novosphingobium nitrogenifigens]EGD57248.1 Hsp33 protein [Novosphingobium nitrogenifigens DSM 19370]
MTAENETGFDRTLRFTVPHRDARGRVVRLGPVLETVLQTHAYPAPIRNLLAEALVLTALLGSLLKDEDGQLTMQAQTNDGVIDLLVCDYRNGELRGYVRHDRARLDELGPNPSLHSLFGDGYLAVTFDLPATGQRYQGIVPLEGETLAAACESYFFQSEQVPTLIRVAVDTSGGRAIAGGLLLQHLPEGEEGRERLHAQLDHPEWQHISVMGGSVRRDELLDPELSLEALVWRLFHEEQEVRVDLGPQLVRGCRCTADYYRNVLARFGAEERKAMADEKGDIVIDCSFCSRLFAIPLAETEGPSAAEA